MTDAEFDLTRGRNQHLLSTVRTVTQAADGTEGEATAFFFRHTIEPGRDSIYLVTNNHVVQDAVEATIVFHTASRDKGNKVRLGASRPVRFQDFSALWSPHPNSGIDLCAVPVETLRDAANGALDDAFFTSLGSHGIPDKAEESRYPPFMQIVMIGYPNGLWDEFNNLPIIRRGMTASHPAVDFQGRPEVVIDMACFPGSSGSPVIFEDRQYFGSAFRFLGVLAAGPTITAEGEIRVEPIPTTRLDRISVETRLMMHLGYVIKGSEVVTMVEAIRQ